MKSNSALNKDMSPSMDPYGEYLIPVVLYLSFVYHLNKKNLLWIQGVYPMNMNIFCIVPIMNHINNITGTTEHINFTFQSLFKFCFTKFK